MRTFAFSFALAILLIFGCTNPKKITDTNIQTLRDNGNNAQQLALQNLGERNLDSAFYYFQEAKGSFVASGDSIAAVYNLLQIADIYKQYNDYIETEASSIEALQLINNPSDSIYNPIIYNNLGIVNRNLDNYKEALKYYQKTLQLTNDPNRAVVINNNIANVLIDSLAFSKAQSILIKQNAIILPQDTITYARVLDNLGFVNHKLSDELGIAQMQKAMFLREKVGDKVGQITSLMHLAESYAEQNTDVAIPFATRANILAKSINSCDDQLEALSFILKNSNNPIEIASTSKQYLKLSDSLLSTRQRAKNEFAAIKYESKSALDKVAALEAEKLVASLTQQRQYLLYGLVLLLIIATSTGLFFWLRNKHRKDKLREGYKVETRIAKKVHDELANDVYHIMTFADAKDLSTMANKELLLDQLDNVYNRTRNISNENSLIDTGENYVSQLKEMMEQYVSSNGRVIINISDSVTWNSIDDIRKITMYRVIQELLVNWRKHSDSSIALIKINQLKNKINIEYSDNGKIELHQTIPKNGLLNVENRIQSIRGTIKFDCNPGDGFRVSINFPL